MQHNICGMICVFPIASLLFRWMVLQMNLHIKLICMVMRGLRLHLAYENVRIESPAHGNVRTESRAYGNMGTESGGSRIYNSSDIRYLSAHSLSFSSSINNKFRSTFLL